MGLHRSPFVIPSEHIDRSQNGQHLPEVLWRRVPWSPGYNVRFRARHTTVAGHTMPPGCDSGPEPASILFLFPERVLWGKG